MPVSFTFIVVVVMVALLFDFINGFHDAANSIATIVSTQVLKPQTAVFWAAFFNFVAFLFFGLSVAATIGKGVVDPSVVDPLVVLAALVGGVGWDLITWYYGIPSSSSHALIGGLAGAAVAKAGVKSLIASGFTKIMLSIVLSPVLGFILAFFFMSLVSFFLARTSPMKINRWFRILQFGSASLYSLGHGGNDAQKTMGIIAVLLFSAGLSGPTFHVLFLGCARLSCSNGTGNALRGVANSAHHGHEDHKAKTGRRLLRGNRGRNHFVSGHLSGHSGVHNAYDYRINHGRGCRPEIFGCSLGSC